MCYDIAVLINIIAMHYYIDVLKKYTVFAGRAARKEYWMFFLFNVIAIAILSVIDNAAGLADESGSGVLSSIYSLAVFLPSLAVGARRLHDIGKSGWLLLLGLIPLLGAVILIVLFCLDSEPGANKYGPNPKGINPSGAAPSEPPAEPVPPTM